MRDGNRDGVQHLAAHLRMWKSLRIHPVNLFKGSYEVTGGAHIFTVAGPFCVGSSNKCNEIM